MDVMTRRRDDILSAQHLNYEAWRDLFRSVCGRYNADGVEPAAFTGWVCPSSVFGFTALNLGSNASGVQRSYRDIRIDGMDQYFVLFQLADQTLKVNHNDQAVRLAVGDVILIDGARPLTSFWDEDCSTWNVITLNLPRQALVSHLGFDPQGGLYRRGGTPAGRVLLDLIRNSSRDEASEFSPGDSYMQLAIYDLVGALFAPTDPGPVSRRTDKLFTRILSVIGDSLADPDFGPVEVAAKAGISLRYLHHLFMERGLTCREFIYSRRLDHAAHLLHRRTSLGTEQPLSEIAYACGFRDYVHFARKFRHRYGKPPSAYSRSNR
jgi:AraC family transcriptional activator of tynA and feaB